MAVGDLPSQQHTMDNRQMVCKLQETYSQHTLMLEQEKKNANPVDENQQQ
jgi:hypothetical protein